MSVCVCVCDCEWLCIMSTVTSMCMCAWFWGVGFRVYHLQGSINLVSMHLQGNWISFKVGLALSLSPLSIKRAWDAVLWKTFCRTWLIKMIESSHDRLVFNILYGFFSIKTTQKSTDVTLNCSVLFHFKTSFVFLSLWQMGKIWV